MNEASLSANSSFIVLIIKILMTLVSLLAFVTTAGWLKGSDSILIPYLGIVIAPPLLILFLASVLILLVLILYAYLLLML